MYLRMNEEDSNESEQNCRELFQYRQSYPEEFLLLPLLYLEEDTCEKEKRKLKRKRKRAKSKFGAAVISDDDDDDMLENPHATQELDDADEESNSEIDDIFKEMQRTAAKAKRPKVSKAGKKKKKKKKKKIKIQGLSFGSSTQINFEDDDEEGDDEGDKPNESESFSKKKEEELGADKQVEVREIKDFAGERVVVKKKVSANSKAAKKFKKQSNLDRLLGSLKGKKKMNTLDKCMIDWEKDKTEEGDGDDLKLAAKDGELDKRQFLLDTDYKQFEIERDIRNQQRKKKGIIL
mmetsp:Transcript_30819/g.52169  ORF Transcript_30819/g.52169 Transcript_30819/m.52169 type:complete len:292 (-) Transcript_30819:202-1077(-)